MNDGTVPSRRALLGATVSVLTSGCTGSLSSRPDCSMRFEAPGPTSAIDIDGVQLAITLAEGNKRRGGSCGRLSSAVCLAAAAEFNSTESPTIDRIEGRDEAGETLVSKPVEDQADVYLELDVIESGDDGGKYTVAFLRNDTVVSSTWVKLDCE